MKILAIGDIVSKQGCEYLRQKLPALKKEYGADIVIANGENSAVGNGILPQSAKYIFDSGVDVITLGNHALRRQEIYDYLDENEFIIRPANFHASAPGRGVAIVDKGYCRVGVINLQGTIFLDNNKNPFDTIDEEIKKLNHYGAIYTVFLVIAVISAAPLFYIGNKWALILWCVIALAAMYFAAKVERIKKDNDVQTYKEIVAFCEGKRLDEIQSAREYGKRPYQKVLWFIGSAAVGAIVSYVLSLLLQSF